MRQTDIIVAQLGGLSDLSSIVLVTGGNAVYRFDNHNQPPTVASKAAPDRTTPEYINAEVRVVWTVGAWQNPDSRYRMQVVLEPDGTLSVYMYKMLSNPNRIELLGEEHDIPATGSAVIPVCERLLAANALDYQGGLPPLD